jgi:arylformamidase
MRHGANLTLSSLTSTVHVGAHADAPSHFHEQGVPIDQVDLAAYVGPCTVVSVTKPRGGLVTPDDLRSVLDKRAERVLVKTGSQPDPQRFNTDFVAFAPEAVAALGAAGVRLVGIDTASVDPFDSKALLAHRELYKWNVRNLEGLVLEAVPDGDYELIALPLKLVGFDASPVRAVLRTL